MKHSEEWLRTVADMLIDEGCEEKYVEMTIKKLRDTGEVLIDLTTCKIYDPEVI